MKLLKMKHPKRGSYKEAKKIQITKKRSILVKEKNKTIKDVIDSMKHACLIIMGNECPFCHGKTSLRGYENEIFCPRCDYKINKK